MNRETILALAAYAAHGAALVMAAYIGIRIDRYRAWRRQRAADRALLSGLREPVNHYRS